MTNMAGSIFDEDEDDIVLPPKVTVKTEQDMPQLAPKPASEDDDNERAAQQLSASMRRLAGESGFARQEGRKKTVYDYDLDDHRNARRKTKTFTQNPETILECFSEFCKLTGKDDKEALYEAFQLLGKAYDFAPLAALPAWEVMRTK